MNIRSLTLKNKFIDENKEEYFDLSAPCFDLTNVGFSDVHLVTQDEEGRIDKICEKYYNTTENIDIVCFVNHIFNPFSVKTGDLLLIPNLTMKESIYKRPDLPGWITGDETKAASSSNKSNEKDENRVNRLKQQKAPRKANDLPEGKAIKKYVNGKIILGTHLNTTNE